MVDIGIEKQAINLKEQWDHIIIKTEHVSANSFYKILEILADEKNCEVFRDYYPEN